jgi:gliding motility-associated-like protein
MEKRFSRNFNKKAGQVVWIKRVLFSLTLLVVFSKVAFSQALGDYRAVASGNWNAIATWQRYDGVAWVAAAAAPTNADGQITIPAGFTVTVTAGVNVDQLDVDGSLVINAGQTLTITDGTTDLAVNGTITVNGTLTLNAGTVNTITGTLINTGVVNPVGLTFNAGATYQHARNGGNIPAATWTAGSFCNVTGVTTTVPGGINQAFSNFTWNCATQSANLTVTLNANLTGSLNIQNTNTYDLILGGNTNLNNNSLTIGPNAILTAGANTITTGTGVLTLNGTLRTSNTTAAGVYGGAGATIISSATPTINPASTIHYNANANQNVFLPAGVNFGNLNISGTGTKTLITNPANVNTLSIASGATLDAGAVNLTVASSNISGTFTDSNVGGTVNLGNVVLTGGTINPTVATALSIGNLTAQSGSCIIGGATNPTNVSGLLSINAGATLTSSGAGAKNYNGGVDNNGIWNTTGNPNITIQGGLSNNGTMIATGTGTYTFTGAQSISGTQPVIFQGNVVMGAAINNNNNGGLTIQGTLTGAGTLTNNTTLKYENAVAPAITGLVNAAGSNFHYSGTTGQAVRTGITYYNLFIEGTSTKTVGAPITVQNNLNIASGTVLNNGANIVTVNQNVSNNGTQTGAGGITITGGAPPHLIAGNGSYQRLTINSNTQLNTGAASISVDDLVLSAGTFSVLNNTLTINNSLSGANVNGLTASSGAGSSIVLNGTAAINLPNTVTSLVNFTLNNAGGTTLAGNLDVTGTLYLTSGLLTMGANTLGINNMPEVVTGYLNSGPTSVLRTLGATFNIPASAVPLPLDINVTGGTVTFYGNLLDDVTTAAGSTLILGNNLTTTGNWSNGGTINATTFSRAVTFSGGNAQSLSLGTYNFYDVIIGKSANGLTLNRPINVYGNWRLNSGTFTPNANAVNFRGGGINDIGGSLPTTFHTLVVNKTGGNAQLSNNITASNALTLTLRGIVLGSYNLTYGGGAATIGNAANSRFIVTNGSGQFIKTGAAAVTAFIGSSVTSGLRVDMPAAAGVGIRNVAGKHPDNPSNTDYLNRYWALTNTTGVGAFTFYYAAGDLVGAPWSAYYNGTWTVNALIPATSFSITPPAGAAIDISGIDNDPPSVVSITPNLATIADANTGAGTFTLTVVYDEDMNTAVVPTINFPTAGENPTPTITYASGTWTGPRTFVASYNVADFDLVMNNIDVAVSNGEDLSGIVQSPNPQAIAAGNGLNAFNINMIGPVVLTAVPNTLLITDATPVFFITITYSTPMNPAIKPTITFPTAGENPNTDGTLAYNSGTSTWDGTNTIFTARFNLADLGLCMNDIDIQVAGAVSAAGNAQALFAPPTLGAMNKFSISMANPVYAGADQEVCGTVNLNATPSSFDTRYWTCNQPGVVYSNSTAPNATVTNLAIGSNIFTWTVIYKGCTSTDQVEILNNQVTTANAGADQILCTNTTSLNGNTPLSGTGIWTVVSGGATFVDPTNPGTVVNNLQRRSNILRWTITRGICSSSDEVTISNFSVDANAGIDDYTCDGTYQLQGNNPITQNIAIPNLVANGTWSTSGPSVFANANAYNTNVNNMQLDVNTYRWTISNAFCSDFDEVDISNDSPTIPNAGPDATFCGIDFAPPGYNSIYNSLTANTPDYIRGETGVWTQVAGASTFLDAPSTTNLRVDNLTPYAQLGGPDFWNLNPTLNTYRWTITYKLCTVYDEVSITNAAPFAANAGPDQNVCWDNADLNAVDLGYGAQRTWWTANPAGTIQFFNPLSGLVDNSPFNAHVENLQIGTTTFRWHKENTLNGLTCTIWDETLVTRVATDIGVTTAGTNQVVCSREALMSATHPSAVFVAPPVYNVTGQWSVISGNANFDDPTDNETRAFNLGYQTNILRWTITNNDLGCIATNDVYITNALPSAAVAGPDQNVCQDQALLSAARPTRGNGSWSVAGGGATISNTTCENFNCNVYVTNLGTGLNTFIWTMHNSFTNPANGQTTDCYLSDEVRIFNNMVTAVAGLDITTCTNEATLAATEPGAGTTGQWTVIGGSGVVTNPALFNSQVTGLSPNLNTLRWTVTHTVSGCTSTDILEITNNNPTDPVVSTPNVNSCDGNAILNGNNPAPNGIGRWSVFNGGGIIANTAAASTTVSNMDGGENIYRWTINKNGCEEHANLTLYNRSVIASAGDDIDNVCGIEPAISSVTLNASAPNFINGESGNWTKVASPGSTIVTPSAFNSQVTGMNNGENIFRWTITNGTCTNSDLVSVFVYIPTTANAGADYKTCAGLTDSRPLTGNTPAPGRGVGSWSLVSGGGMIANSANAVTSVSNLAPDLNVFRWTINYNNCLSTDDVTITNNIVTANAGPDDLVCVDNYTLAANDPQTFFNGNAVPSGQWTLRQGAGIFADHTLYNTVVTGLSTAMTNIYRWTVTKDNCEVYDDVSIINNSFTISANIDQTVCDNFAFLDAQQPGTGSGAWSVVSGGGAFVNNTLYNTRVNGLSINPNQFRWTVTRNGCSASDDVIVYNNKVVSDAGITQRVCDNFATLNGNEPAPAGATGNWVATTGGASITAPNIRNSGVTNLANGQNTFEWTISRTLNGVTCTDTKSVDVFNDKPSDAVIEADKEVCTNSTTLSVTTIPIHGSGLWSRVDNLANFDNFASFNPSVTNLNRGINTFRWTVTNGTCSDSEDIIVTNNSVIANVITPVTTSCTSIATLTGNNPALTQGNGVWTDLDASGAIIANSTAFNTTVSGLPQGNTRFRWAVSLGTCPAAEAIVTVTNNQVTATAGSDQDICSDSFGPLQGNDVSGIGATGVWESIGNTAIVANSTLFNTSVSGLDPGMNTFRWTVTSAAEGCTAFDEVILTNNGVVANAGNDIETCSSSVNLGAVNPTVGTGSWTQTGGALATIVDATNRQSQVTGLTGGVYTFTWTVINGSCSATDEVIVTNSSPSVSNPTTSTPEVCTGNGSLQANAAGPGETGIWTGGAGSTIVTPLLNNTDVTGMPLGVNTYTWTLTKGTSVTCISANSVSITNNQVVANAGIDKTTVCNSFVTLSGNNPLLTQGTGTWTDQSGTTATIVNSNSYNTQVNNIRPGTTTFRWTVSQGTCSVFDEVIITNNQITANAGVDQTTCNNYYEPLDGNDVSVSGGTGLWTSTTPGVTFVSATNFATRVNNLQTGINTLRWTVTSAAEGCTAFDEVILTNNGVVANAGNDIETCSSSVNLGAVNPTVGTGSWTQTGGALATIVDATNRQSQVTGLTGGVYTFTWTVINGSCSATDEVIVTNSSPSVSNPTTSTPEVCTGNGSLQANAAGPGETGIWTGGAGSTILTPLLNNTNVTGMPLGVNTYTWTLTKGTSVTCISANSVSITNNQVVANAGIDKTTVCNSFVTLSGNNPLLTQGTGTWTDQSGTTATIVNSNSYNTQVNNIRPGTTTFRWTVSQGTCSVFDEVIITNNQITANAGVDQTTCNNYYEPLDGNDVSVSGGTGLWTSTTPGVTFVSATNFATRVNNLQTGINTLRWTVTSAAEGCTAFDEVILTNNGVVANAGNDIETCSSSVNLGAVNPTVGTGSWTQTGGAVATIVDAANRQSQVTGLTSGVYTFTWTVINGSCSATDEVIVTNSSPSVSNPTTSTPEVCTGNGSLQANAAGPGETGIWTGGAGSTIVTPLLNNTDVTGMPLGVNTYTWTLTKGTSVTCISANSVSITNNQVVANAGIDKTTVCNSFVTLSGNNPLLTQGTGTWTDQSGTTATIVNSNSYNTQVNNIRPGTTTFRWTVSQGTCSVFDEVIITNNQITANAGVDQTTCNNYYEPLDGNDVSVSGGTGLWTSTTPGVTFVSATNFATRVNNLQTGINTLRWTVTSAAEGCTAFDEVILTNNGVVANAGNDIETCSSSVNLGAVNPTVGTGSWTQTGGALATIVDATNRQSQVTGLTGGVYTFTWTVINGSCSATDEVIVTNSSPSVSNPTTSTPEVCTGNGSLQANAAGPGETGIWTGGAGSTILTPLLNNTNVTGMPLGVNTYTWTLTKGTSVTCISANSVSITNNQVVANAGIDKTTVCNSFVTLSGNNPLLTQGTGTWTDQSGTTATIVNSNSYNTQVNNIRPGTTTFRWTVSQGTCSVFDEVIITNNQITANAGVDQTTCNNYYEPLDGNDVSVSGGTGLWTSTTPGVTFVSATNFATRVNNLQTGINTLRWTVTSAAEGCTAFDEVIITNNGVVANAGNDIETCSSSVNLGAVNPTVGTGSWTQTGGAVATIVDAANRQSQVTGLTGGVYTFTWTVINGSCSATDEVIVTNSSPSVSNPTTSTPEVCTGNGSLQANAAGPGETGIWTGGAGSTIVTPLLNNTDVTGMPLGVNTYTWTLTKGTSVTCISANSVSITNNQVVANAGIDKTTVCNNFVTLSGNNPLLTQGTGTWTDQSGTTATIVNSNSYNTQVNNIRPGTTTFRWTVSQGTCSVFDEVIITNNQITANAGVDQTTCNNYYEPLDGNDVSVSGGTGLWTSTTPGVTFVAATNFATRVNNLQTGINTLRWTVTSAAEGCTAFDEVILTNNGVVANAGNDIETCSSSVNLGAVNPTVGTGSWTQTGGALATIVDATNRQSQVTGLTGGVYTFTWTVINGSCSATDEVIVTNSSPSVSNPTTSTPEVCTGNGSLQANAAGPGETGFWTKVDATGTIDNSTSSVTFVTGLKTGANVFKWTLLKGSIPCSSEATVTITNNAVNASAAVGSSYTCTSSVQLSGNNPSLQSASGLWTVSSGATIVDATNFATSANNLPLGPNVFTWTVTRGTCSASANTTVDNRQVIAAVVGTQISVCDGTANLNAIAPVPPVTGVWTLESSDMPGVTISNSTLFDTQVNGINKTATFKWRVSNGDCHDESFVTVNNNKVVLNPGITQTICSNTGNLNAGSLESGQTGFWSSPTVGPIIVQSNAISTEVQSLNFGTNIFYWNVTAAGCPPVSSEYRIISEKLVANAGSDQNICEDFTNLSGNNPSPGTGVWTQVGGNTAGVVISSGTATNLATVTGLIPGSYTFKWTVDYNGCKSEDFVVVNNNSFSLSAGLPQVLCGSSTNLNGDPVPSGGIGTWTRFGGFGDIDNINSHSSLVTNLGQGDNSFRWTVRNAAGCEVSKEVVVTNNQPAKPSVTSSATLTCNTSVTLTGDVPPTNATGTWTRIAGSANIQTPNNNITLVTNLSDNNTFVYTIDKFGCRDTSMVSVVYQGVTASVNDDFATCSSTASLKATLPAAGNGVWTGGPPSAIIANSTAHETTVTGLAQGDNIFYWTVTRGTCFAFDELRITNNAPDVANAGLPQNYCPGDILTMSANQPSVGVGTWSAPVGSVTVFNNVNAHNTTVNMPEKAGPYSEVFTWTIVNNGCTSSHSVAISNNGFIPFVNANDFTCSGSYNLLGRNPSTVSGTASGFWEVRSGGGIFSNSTSFNSTVSGMNQGTNSYRWTITNIGCERFAEVIIDNNLVTADVSGFMSCTSTVNILANNPVIQSATGLWSVDNQTTQLIGDQTNYSTSVSGLVPNAINRLRWTVSKGACSATDTMNIEYFVPNAKINIPDIVHGCSDVVQLIADPNLGGGSGSWSVKSGISEITFDCNTCTTTFARNMPVGTHVFVWTVTNRGCTSSAEVSVNNSKPVNIAGSDKSGCSNTFTMDGQVPVSGSGVWQTISGTVSYANSTSPTTIVTVAPGTNILQWTINADGCSTSKLFNVENNLTTPNAGNDRDVCENRVLLAGSNLKPGETGTWSIDGGGAEIFSSTTINNPEVTNLRKGEITFVWTVTNGICPSEDRVKITNNTPYVDAGPDRTICENFTTLVGNDPTVDKPGSTGIWTIGNTNVVISNPNNNSTDVSNLSTGSNLFTWTVNNGICSAKDEVRITSNAISVSAGVSTSACSDILALSGTQPPAGTSGYWTASEGTGIFDNSTVHNTTVRNLSAFNKLRWTIVSGLCSFSDEITFISLLPTKAQAEGDKAECQNFTFITANPPQAGETGLWTKVVASAGVTISNPTSYQTNITSLDLGTNVFKWTISNSTCSTSDLITVTNNQVFADAGSDQTTCTTDYSLTANLIYGNGTWTNSGGVLITNSTSANTTVSNLNFGPNSFLWTVGYNGCTATDEVIITSNLPRNVTAGTDQNVCSGTTNLAASNPGIGSGLWENIGGSGVIANKTSNQTTVTNLAVGENIFRWTVTVGSCSVSSQVRINNNSLYVSAGTNNTICNTDQYQLNGNPPAPGINGEWTVSGGSGVFDNSTQHNTIVRNLTKGINTYVWTLRDGVSCENSSTVTIINNTPDDAVAQVIGTGILCTDSVNLSAIAVANGVGTWSVQSGYGLFVNPNANNTKVININKGPNTFRWTVNKNGCTDFADVNVTNRSVDAFIANKDIVICTPTHTATIIGNDLKAGETGTWTKISVGSGNISSPNNHVSAVTDVEFGSTFYRWTVDNIDCDNSDDLRITNNYYKLTSANVVGLATLCENFTSIQGSLPPTGATGLWSSTAPDVTFDNRTAVNTVVRNLPGGTSTLTWTITKDGCASPSSFSLINNSIYTSAGADKVVCQTSTSLNALSLLAGQTGFWIVDNLAVTITNSTNPSTQVSNLITGNNTFTWTINGNGCSATDQVIISNNAFTVTAGNNEISCGPNYTLRGSDPLSGTGLWTINAGGGVFANQTNFETLVTGVKNGPNTYTWTVNRNGCTASNNVTITNDLYVAVVGQEMNVCANTATVTAQPVNPASGANGQWSTITGGGIVVNPTSFSSVVNGLALGPNRFRWTVTKGTCVSTADLLVNNNTINASAGTDQTTCDNFATLTATPLGLNETGLWTSGGVGILISTPTLPNTEVSNLQTGVNTFAWNVSNNVTRCSSTSTVRVTSNFFRPYAGVDQNIDVNSATMTARLPVAGATGEWTVVSGAGDFVNSTNPTTVVNNLGFGDNTFRWTVRLNSCTYSDDVTITYNAIFAFAGNDTTICDTIVMLRGNDPWPGSGSWRRISGTGTVVSPNSVTTPVIGIRPNSVNIFRWTVVVNNISRTDDVIILNKQFALSAGTDKPTCSNSVVMNAEPPGIGTGDWRVISGSGTFSNLNDPNATVTNLSEGFNRFEWTVSKTGGCTNSDTVSIFFDLPPQANFTTNVTSGCSPINVQFTNTSTGAVRYYWNFGNDFSEDFNPPVQTYRALFDKDSIFNIKLIAYDESNCTDTIVRQVTAFAIPIVDFEAYPKVQTFPDATINIDNNSGAGYSSYYWDFGDGQTALQNRKEGFLYHRYTTWGTFEISLAVFAGQCTDTARQTITILVPKPVSTEGRDYAECEPLTVNFKAATLYATRYRWDFGDGATSTSENPIYIYDTPGVYTVNLYAAGPGTNDSLIFIRKNTIVVYPKPVANFIVLPDSVMLPNQAIHCYNRSTYGHKYEWDFGLGNNTISSLENPKFYYTVPGKYFITLRVWSEHNCKDDTTAVVPIVVENFGVCKFPNAFSPNPNGPSDGRYIEGDPSNDIFHPKHRGVREYKLEIFDRWGAKVFESNNVNIGWDGYINGKLAAQDVYVWKVSGKYKNGSPFKDAGDVTLMR